MMCCLASSKAGAPILKRRRGEFAPQAIIQCVEAACSGDMSFDDGMDKESELFMQCLTNPQSKALQHFFFAERMATKVPGLKAKPIKLKSVGVIGAGLMGGGIAMASAEAGLNVVIIDVAQESLDKGMSVINANYQRSVQRQSMTADEAQAAFGRIKPSLKYSDLGACDLVVEAVFENMNVKKSIFAELDKVCKKGCILSSNTSGLDIDEIASATSRPEDVVGCHFFSPANVMKLLENVKGSKSSPTTIATAMKFGSMIGKVPVLVGNCPGFVANRIFGHYSTGARQVLMMGGLPHTVDSAAESFGMRMGQCENPP